VYNLCQCSLAIEQHFRHIYDVGRNDFSVVPTGVQQGLFLELSANPECYKLF